MLQQRGSKLGLPVWGGLLFGLPFVAAGFAILLVAIGVLRADPKSIHAPLWVLGVVGTCFAGGGLFIWGATVQEFVARRRRLQATQDRPSVAALQDYNWDVHGYRVSEWATALKTILGAFFLTVFLSIFNWWAFVANGPLPVKIIVGLFDLITLFAWCNAFKRIGWALTFGHSEILYSRFPFPTSGAVNVRCNAGKGISRIEKGTFTLRCVEQWMEQSGTEKHRRHTLIQEEFWSSRWVLQSPRNLQLGESVELSFDLPTDAPSTCLNNARPVFWELDIQLELPGLDFRERYLVPIY